MPVDHYENFPVASFLLPPAMRAPIEAIYRFARAADDIADEGEATPEERLAGLAAFHAELDRLEAGQPSAHPVFQPLAPVIAQYRLPFSLFRDLLDAFAQDVGKKRYADYAELLDYCRRSANPVGRLVLHLRGNPTPEMCAQSDAICSALQQINFWQDVMIDWQKGRVYLPREDLARFEVSEADIGAARVTSQWRALMAFQVERTRALMESGAPLVRQLSGRLAWEIRCTVQGGLRILEKTREADYDVFRHRPVLTFRDWLLIAARAVFRPCSKTPTKTPAKTT
ncbi:MAG: squalene synthase HpnC [Zoogloeaceae bacterium]|jgi:squalene synthase HpnC|nr:squalene synthase HpnC [Zoogloeaceae bacterium]